MQLRSRWPAVRAAIVALALGLGLVDGCPIPDRAATPRWALGFWGAADAARDVIRRPIAGLAADLDVSQRWTLFRGASRRRFRLWVEGKPASGDWRPLYRAGDPAHAEYEDLLSYRRVRGTYSPSGQTGRGQYYAFAVWMMLRALDDHPDLAVARVRLERVVIGEGEYTPTGEFTSEQQERRRRR